MQAGGNGDRALPAMRLSRGTRLALGALALVGVSASAIAGWIVWRLGPIGSAYAAKTACTGVFVSGRTADEVYDVDVVADNHPLLALTRVRVDTGNAAVHADFAGLRPRHAQYLPGRGCTLEGAAVNAPLSPMTVAAAIAQAPDPVVQGVLDRVLSDPGPRTRALAVMHGGRLVAQGYAPGFAADTALPGWSMSKTMTAVLAGIAVGRGVLHLGTTALLPQWADDGRRDIALEHLLRMTDGLAFDEDPANPLSDAVAMLLLAPDAAGFAAAKPLRATPGSTWRYSSGSSNVLMRVVADALGYPGATAAAVAREVLFQPLGMDSAVVEPDLSGLPVGSSFMHASAHDWLRFGQFLMQDGVWDGVRVLPEGWVRTMRRPTPASGAQAFGAHVWLRVPDSYAGPARASRPLPADAFHAIGHEGQFMSIIPSRGLVVLRLGLTRPPHRWNHQAFLADVLDALAPAR